MVSGKKVFEAMRFAYKAHEGQKYGKWAYSLHLDAVADLALPFGDEAVVVAYLHDTVEDTAVTLDEIGSLFGEHVARCVSLLTDAPGKTRKIKKERTYAEMAKVDSEASEALALVVKTCDRLANVRQCAYDGNKKKLGMYQKEHPLFKKSVYREGLCDELWSELDSLLKEG